MKITEENIQDNVRYIFGSQDSTDVDVAYVFDTMPSLDACKKFCSADPNENRNIIVINDGVITECYKGTPDETNNAILNTYHLHEQEHQLLITKPLYRDVKLKLIRATRIILSHLSRSQYRTEIKYVLRSGMKNRLLFLENLEFNTIDFDKLNNHMTREDILKIIAFQLMQMMGLMHGKEYYTKADMCKDNPAMTPYLYRHKDSDVYELQILLYKFIGHCDRSFEITDGLDSDGVTVLSTITDKPNPDGVYYVYDLKHEKLIHIEDLCTH